MLYVLVDIFAQSPVDYASGLCAHVGQNWPRLEVFLNGQPVATARGPHVAVRAQYTCPGSSTVLFK